MASWNDPVGDLRTFLADTPQSNLVKNRPVLGTKDSVNQTFYTFDDRLIADVGYQNVATSPLRLFFDGVEIAASGILVTDQVRGEFQVMQQPDPTQLVTASYHFQQHLDSELTVDLQQAALQVNADAAANIPGGLQLAALNIAGSIAHGRLAQRWQQRKSEQFLLQDLPMRQEAESLIVFHQNEAKRMMADGLAVRRSFYDFRQDRGRAPAFGLLKRTPQPWTPRQ